MKENSAIIYLRKHGNAYWNLVSMHASCYGIKKKFSTNHYPIFAASQNIMLSIRMADQCIQLQI